MPVSATWSEIAIRLLCAIVAGALIGSNRSEHGHAAGLRTSLLVCLAACIAMIQVNLLLPLAGRPSNSFVMNDLMRLPLGILSGMGFIGAGAIVRRDNLVTGITTAATLWFLTVLGLCFGGGQISLGLIGMGIGFIVLAGFKAVENRMDQEHRGKLSIVSDLSGPTEGEIRRVLEADGFQCVSSSLTYKPAHNARDSSSATETRERVEGSALITNQTAPGRELAFELQWRAKPFESDIPQAINMLAERPGVCRLDWTPQAQ
jgi:putative Mg2+ transporter-C (MgtC) family protein